MHPLHTLLLKSYKVWLGRHPHIETARRVSKWSDDLMEGYLFRAIPIIEEKSKVLSFQKKG
jgi:hypothetical protein